MSSIGPSPVNRWMPLFSRTYHKCCTTVSKLWVEDTPSAVVVRLYADVFRSALIGLGDKGAQVLALVVQPREGLDVGHSYFREQFLDSVRCLAKSHPVTRDIEKFFIKENFPVDIRHNAKIHRLALSEEFSRIKE